MSLVRAAIVLSLLLASTASAQHLPAPERPANSPSGIAVVQSLSSLSLVEREERIRSEILSGNLPSFMRELRPVTVTQVSEGRTNSATFFVTPDYLAVGDDEDYFLVPMAPGTAQVIADRWDCSLPTRKMVDAIYAAAESKLVPSPIPPSPAMTTIPVFQHHNDTVRTQRLVALPRHPLGALVAGHKKDVVITPRLATNDNRVAIYGWHQTNGQPIQPLYLGHTSAWVDYSHGIRLVQQRMTLNGETTRVSRVLADPKFAGLLSDEGVITNACYPTNFVASPQIKFKPAGRFQERIASLAFAPDVRIQINAPPTEDFAPGKPVLLILYALPNGNTIEQTIGKKLRPGDDWHFDIQHIGAQTRFLRNLLTNRTVVVACLETEMKSWPAWRRKHGNGAIPGIVARIKGIFPTSELEVVLTGHSGGGSFTFGYLNALDRIPDDVVRIAFLDSNYAYETTNHLAKLTAWLKASPDHTLCVLAYHDSVALLDGKTFVSERGGTWGRSHAMLIDLSPVFPFTSRTNATGLQTHVARDGRLQFLLQENPEKKILHTVQVERNGFIHALLTGTTLESRGYQYFGERAYPEWISTD